MYNTVPLGESKEAGFKVILKNEVLSFELSLSVGICLVGGLHCAYCM